MDAAQIALGQRDLSIILAIYVDNISEGKLVDFFPVCSKPSSTSADTETTVKTLEAFFSEPKQRKLSVRFSLEGVNFSLFFDSGELLSSPIRDLNHGLCKLVVGDVATSFVVFTDNSLDGKLSVDTLVVEEIGTDVNVCDKR